MDILMQDNRLPMKYGDFVLVDGVEKIKQHIKVALYTLLGDWLLDYEKGIDLVRGLRHLVFLDHDIKKQIMGVDGVISIRSYKRVLDRKFSKIKIDVIISTNQGQIKLDEVFNIGNR